jgi:glyoxylase-like metal-dependent hydrolase (beta-lactamase superfamily II)
MVHTFFDESTNTGTHIVWDPETRRAAIVDSVLDFDAASGRMSYASAERVAAWVERERLDVDWLLETHIHADHLSAAAWLRARLGGKMAISSRIPEVQELFGNFFNSGQEFARDGSQFDVLLDDGDTFYLGNIGCVALHVPGHTPADVALVVGDTVFVGDTLFMPDSGTARADFPGGDARILYRSIQRLLLLPDETRMFLCHDYRTSERQNIVLKTTVGAQRAFNIHVGNGTDEESFVVMRTERDAALAMPKLIMPSIQINIAAGELPAAESNGNRYLKIAIDGF